MWRLFPKSTHLYYDCRHHLYQPGTPCSQHPPAISEIQIYDVIAGTVITSLHIPIYVAEELNYLH